MTVSFRGGSVSIQADADRLAGYAALLATSSSRLRELARRPIGQLAEPSLLVAAPLDPSGAAAVAELAGVCFALAGLAVLHCVALTFAVRAAVESYRLADSLDRQVEPLLRAVRELPAAVVELGHGPRHWSQALARDADVVDAAVDLLAFAVTPYGPDRRGTAASFAAAYRDGQPVVTARPDLPSADSFGPPRSVTDLFAGLALRNMADDGGGTVDVRVLSGPRVGNRPPERRVIVDISATSRWNVDPLARTPQATDFGTNVRTIANESSIMERGVLEILRRSGIGPDVPIMLVGHSQGGMVAGLLASDLARSGEFRVTHLVTAGAPLGLARVPKSVSVLALENRGDVVPQLDGADNPASANWLTARVDHGPDSVGGRHSLASYLDGARDLDVSDDPGVASWRAGAAGFLDATTVRTEVFQVRR